VIPGGEGWDESPLGIQVPDDARELDRDVLAYHRELRARRRRARLRRLAGPFAGHGTIMPLLASILAVCLVAGAMLSVATVSPANAPTRPSPPQRPTATASPPRPAGTASPRPAARRPGGHAASPGGPATARPSDTGGAVRLSGSPAP
jgi:hypothetical protein